MHTLKIAVMDPATVPGGYSFQLVHEVLASRIHLLPPFTRRIVPVPYGLHHPVWVEDPDFDLADHLFRAVLPAPGGPRELGDSTGPSRCGRSTSSRDSNAAASPASPRSITRWPTACRAPRCSSPSWVTTACPTPSGWPATSRSVPCHRPCRPVARSSPTPCSISCASWPPFRVSCAAPSAGCARCGGARRLRTRHRPASSADPAPPSTAP